MKKLKCSAFGLCALSIIFAGCTYPHTTDVSETMLPPKVSLILEKDTYSVEDDVIHGVLKNDTDVLFLLSPSSILCQLILYS